MSYTTKAAMIDRFGDSEVIALTDRARNGVIDDAVLTAALVTADAEIDPYLASRYTLPLTTVPKVVSGFACDIVRYRLCGTGGVMETDEIRNRYKDAIKFLEAVRDGKITLGVDAANVAPNHPSQVQIVSGSDRVFTGTSLAGF